MHCFASSGELLPDFRCDHLQKPRRVRPGSHTGSWHESLGAHGFARFRLIFGRLRSHFARSWILVEACFLRGDVARRCHCGVLSCPEKCADFEEEADGAAEAGEDRDSEYECVGCFALGPRPYT